MSTPDKINHGAFLYYDRLRRVESYVSNNLANPITLEEIAGVAGLSPAYFSTFFHAKAGITFKTWLTGLRLQRAKELLQRKNIQITQAAQESGFQSLRSFQRAFKKQLGISARDFKKRVTPS